MFSEYTIAEALESNIQIIDVRSPKEFSQGHITGAINIPLFTDYERENVGTVFKKKSKQAAIDLAYDYVTPKLDWYVNESKKVAPSGTVIIHCWRGGMRSESFANHLDKNGFNTVFRITGGYKAYRNYVLEIFKTNFNLSILGGYTGSGKTHVLHELSKLGQQIIDLESLAHHKGSAFGGIGQRKQPTTEQFENDLYNKISTLDMDRTIWIEDESHSIGSVSIPMSFFEQIRNSKLYFIEVPLDERVKLLVEEYSCFNKNMLTESIHRISKRLGGLNTQHAINCLENNDFDEVARIALQYYDKCYLKGMKERTAEKIITIKLQSIDHNENAIKLLSYLK